MTGPGLSPALLKEIRRLKASPPTEPPATVVQAAAGDVPLPPALAALGSVYWDPEYFLVTKLYDHGWSLGSAELIDAAEYVRGCEEELFQLGADEHDNVLVARLADTSDDPIVFELDHDGSSKLEDGTRFSAFLKQLKAVARNPKPKSKLATKKQQWADALCTHHHQRVSELIAEGPVHALDSSGFTTLHLAVAVGLQEAVEGLLAAGANPNAQVKKAGRFSWRDSQVDRKFTTEFFEGETPLHLAVSLVPNGGTFHARLRIVRALLGAGADPNIADGRGRPSLSRVFSATYAPIEVITDLLKAGAQIPPDGSPWDHPMFQAVSSQNLEHLQALLAAGVPPTGPCPVPVPGVTGPTIIHHAAHKGWSAGVAALLDAGADPNQPSEDGVLPLACARGPAEVLLMVRGARKQ